MLGQAAPQSHSQSTGEPSQPVNPVTGNAGTWCPDSLIIQPQTEWSCAFILKASFQTRENVLHASLRDCALANLVRKPSFRWLEFDCRLLSRSRSYMGQLNSAKLTSMTSSPMPKMGAVSLFSKSRNWNQEVEKLKKQLEKYPRSLEFLWLAGISSNNHRTSHSADEAPMFWLLRSLHKTKNVRGLHYITQFQWPVT